MSPSDSRHDSAAASEMREAILSAAILQYRARAFHEVDSVSIARQARLSEDDLQREFSNADELLMATVEKWNEQRMRPLAHIGSRHGAVAFLRAIVTANIVDPGLLRLQSATVNIAATPAHPLAPALQENWVRFHASVQRFLAEDIRVGREPATMEPSNGAEQLIAIFDGLQLQSLLRPNMDLLAAFDRAVTRLRSGWTQPYERPVWHL